MAKITKRQEDVLLNIHPADQAYEGERTLEAWESYSKRHGEPVPEWGRPATYQHSGRAGGSRHRMMERIMDEGLIPARWSSFGHRYAITSRLTVKGLHYLAKRFPSLPGIAEGISEAVARKEEAKAKLESERAAAAEDRLARAEKRAAERRERMAAVLQDFQLRHELTGEQLEAMWLRIVEEEHSV